MVVAVSFSFHLDDERERLRSRLLLLKGRVVKMCLTRLPTRILPFSAWLSFLLTFLVEACLVLSWFRSRLGLVIHQFHNAMQSRGRTLFISINVLACLTLEIKNPVFS